MKAVRKTLKLTIKRKIQIVKPVEHRSKKSLIFEKMMDLDDILKRRCDTWRTMSPLAVGILTDLFEWVESRDIQHSRKTIRHLLKWHCNSPSYLSRAAYGKSRFFLDGKLASKITKQENEYSLKRYREIGKIIKAKKKAKKVRSK